MMNEVTVPRLDPFEAHGTLGGTSFTGWVLPRPCSYHQKRGKSLAWAVAYSSLSHRRHRLSCYYQNGSFLEYQCQASLLTWAKIEPFHRTSVLLLLHRIRIFTKMCIRIPCMGPSLFQGMQKRSLRNICRKGMMSNVQISCWTTGHHRQASTCLFGLTPERVSAHIGPCSC